MIERGGEDDIPFFFLLTAAGEEKGGENFSFLTPSLD